MIMLNLLSPAQKESLRARVLYAMIERLMIAFLAALLMTSVLLSLIKIRLTQNVSQVVGRQLLSTEYVTVNNEVKQLNATIVRVETLQQTAVPVSVLIRDIAGRTPPGIVLNGFDFDVKTKAMRLSGSAETREALLAYEKTMRGSPYIARLESPISNLFLKRGINFQFQILLDTEALKKTLEPSP